MVSCLFVLVPLIAGSTSILSTRYRRFTATCLVSVWSHCQAQRVARTLAWWPHCWLPTQHLSPIFFLTKSTLVLLWVQGTQMKKTSEYTRCSVKLWLVLVLLC